jgi:hypothetical protein
MTSSRFVGLLLESDFYVELLIVDSAIGLTRARFDPQTLREIPKTIPRISGNAYRGIDSFKSDSLQRQRRHRPKDTFRRQPMTIGSKSIFCIPETRMRLPGSREPKGVRARVHTPEPRNR